jgi:hypothetical protein
MVLTPDSFIAAAFASNTSSIPLDVSAPVTERTLGRSASDTNPVPQPKSSTSMDGANGIRAMIAAAASCASFTRGGVSHAAASLSKSLGCV